MFKIHFGWRVFKPAQNICFKLLLLSLFVANISPQMNIKRKQEVEAMIYTIKSHYLNIMGKHSDWLKRILEVVKLELTYRQEVWNCRNETCLYSIKLPEPFKPHRDRRSVDKKEGRYTKVNKMPRKKTNFQTILKYKTSKSKVSPKKFKTPKYNPMSKKPSENHMSECRGKYVYYCKNGAKCVYIDLLQEAVCMCRKGFTGKRCVDFSLSDTVQSLRDYEMKTLNISKLNKKDHEAILSVMDATA